MCSFALRWRWRRPCPSFAVLTMTTGRSIGSVSPMTSCSCSQTYWCRRVTTPRRTPAAFPSRGSQMAPAEKWNISVVCAACQPGWWWCSGSSRALLAFGRKQPNSFTRVLVFILPSSVTAPKVATVEKDPLGVSVVVVTSQGLFLFYSNIIFEYYTCEYFTCSPYKHMIILNM